MTSNLFDYLMNRPLRAEDAFVIRAVHKICGLSSTEIAHKYGVPRTTVSDVLNRKTWAKLPVGQPAWLGIHPRHEQASSDTCGLSHPEDFDLWCQRPRHHPGHHMAAAAASAPDLELALWLLREYLYIQPDEDAPERPAAPKPPSAPALAAPPAENAAEPAPEGALEASASVSEAVVAATQNIGALDQYRARAQELVSSRG